MNTPLVVVLIDEPDLATRKDQLLEVCDRITEHLAATRRNLDPVGASRADVKSAGRTDRNTDVEALEGVLARAMVRAADAYEDAGVNGALGVLVDVGPAVAAYKAVTAVHPADALKGALVVDELDGHSARPGAFR